MADIKKISEQIVEVGERLGSVADAARGKDGRSGALRARWLLLPAAGAGLYALATTRTFTRQAKEVVGEVKTRASDLPDELISRVHQATSSSGKERTPSNRGSRSRRRSKSTTSSR
jgi:hypothetical protein